MPKSTEFAPADTLPPPAPQAAPVVVAAPAVDEAAAPQLMTFGIWFQSLKRPAHHAIPMQKFANTSGRRSAEDWSRVFAPYGI